MVVLYMIILFTYLFFPKFNFITKYTPTIIIILFSLNLLSIKYIDKK